MVEQNSEEEAKSEMHVPVSEVAVGTMSNNVDVGAGSPNLLILVVVIDADGNVDTSQSLTPNGVNILDEEANHKADAFFGETCSTNDDNTEPAIPDVEGKAHNSMVSSSNSTCSDPPHTTADTKCHEVSKQGLPTSDIGDITVDTVDVVQCHKQQFHCGIYNEGKVWFMSVIIHCLLKILSSTKFSHNSTTLPAVRGVMKKNSLLKLSHILHSMRYASNAFQDRELIESLLTDVMGHSSLAKQEDAHEFFTALTEN